MQAASMAARLAASLSAAVPTGRRRAFASRCLVDLYKQRTAAEGLRHSPAQVACIERLEALRAELAAAGSGAKGSQGQRRGLRGVYIYGDPGGGKTMVMDMFHAAATASGVPSRRAHFHDFMIDLSAELHRLRKQVGAVSDPLAHVAENFLAASPLLCFDECHVLNVGDAMIMRAFFERLFAAGGTVVATSNLAPDKLYSSGINREVFQPFIDAVLRHCDAVQLSAGEDFRTAKSRQLAAADGERSFFWPLGPHAEAKLRAALAALRGVDEAPVACEVSVPLGRKLCCRRAWLDGVRVAEFSHEELCAAAVGTPDYVAISEAFDAVVLTGVPRFREADEDAARRFASLIDVLYDRRKRLLCTIDAPPRDVFAAIRSQYDGGIEEDPVAASSSKSAICVPSHGGSSGRHVSAFRLPKAQLQLQYTDSGGYGVAADPAAGLAATQMEPEEAWVEWSATGLKDASMFDLTCHTTAQRHDRLLPLLRCESRLEEMSFLR